MSTEVLIRCSRCKLDLPTDQFTFDGSRKSGFCSRCKKCRIEYQHEYRQKNLEKKKQADAEYYRLNAERIKARMAEYREENREAWNESSLEYTRLHPQKHAQHRRDRRARRAEVVYVPYTLEQLAARLSMWNGLCWICRKRPGTTIDHVKPISKGGPEMLSNMRPACFTCNAHKKDTWPFDPRKVR